MKTASIKKINTVNITIKNGKAHFHYFGVAKIILLKFYSPENTNLKIASLRKRKTSQKVSRETIRGTPLSGQADMQLKLCTN